MIILDQFSSYELHRGSVGEFAATDALCAHNYSNDWDRIEQDIRLHREAFGRLIDHLITTNALTPSQALEIVTGTNRYKIK